MKRKVEEKIKSNKQLRDYSTTFCSDIGKYDYKSTINSKMKENFTTETLPDRSPYLTALDDKNEDNMEPDDEDQLSTTESYYDNVLPTNSNRIDQHSLSFSQLGSNNVNSRFSGFYDQVQENFEKH